MAYARVSTRQQELNRQPDLLKRYNCHEILTEKLSGTKTDRSELNLLKDKLQPEDMVVAESFSRLGRNTKDLIELVAHFEEWEIKLLSIKESFYTSTSQGKLMMTVFQAFIQFERDLIVQRTKEGLLSGRARGLQGGRPKINDRELKKALNLY